MAMLKGMGWSEGKPIGLNNAGLVEPIEYIPRHKGLGLGAEKRNEPNNSTRKRKLGDDDLKKKVSQLIFFVNLFIKKKFISCLY